VARRWRRLFVVRPLDRVARERCGFLDARESHNDVDKWNRSFRQQIVFRAVSCGSLEADLQAVTTCSTDASDTSFFQNSVRSRCFAHALVRARFPQARLGLMLDNLQGFG
jgi:hypothetical protein